jgi:hypothetical protein
VEVLPISDVDRGFRGETQPITPKASMQALSATFNFFDRLFASTLS